MLEQISDKLKQAEKIIFVTGAGISQESGIPTFRGKDGLWRKYDPMKLATIDAFYEDPKLVWEWYEERRKNILAAKPNPGHLAIVQLEKKKPVHVLTQNIDGLHQRVGVKVSTSFMEVLLQSNVQYVTLRIRYQQVFLNFLLYANAEIF